MIYIGSQSKFIPYVVEVDKLGQTIAVSPMDRAKGVNQGVIIVVAASMRLQRWRQDDYPDARQYESV